MVTCRQHVSVKHRERETYGERETYKGTIHSTKISGDFGLKLNVSARSKRMKQLAQYHLSSRICNLTPTRATAINQRETLFESGVEPVAIHLPPRNFGTSARKFWLNGSRP